MENAAGRLIVPTSSVMLGPTSSSLSPSFFHIHTLSGAHTHTPAKLTNTTMHTAPACMMKANSFLPNVSSVNRHLPLVQVFNLELLRKC